MSNRTFASLFVFVTFCVGSVSRLARDFNVPFLVRGAAVVASVLLLVWWLQRRLNRPQPATTKETP